MALSGLDIYKLLPKTNCRECGFATCLAFAMQLAKKAVNLDRCPFLSEEAKKILEASSLPPIKTISIGQGDNRLEIGGETVLFRHEDKFHRPCGLGFILEDSESEARLLESLEKVNTFAFERVGQQLKANLVALRQTKDAERFARAVSLTLGHTDLGLVLMSKDPAALKRVLPSAASRRPLLYCATTANAKEMSALAKEFKCPLVAAAEDLGSLSELTRLLEAEGCGEIVLDTGMKGIRERVWDLTQVRRLALKKNNRALGYPVLTVVERDDPCEEAMEAATYIAKYSGIVLVRNIEQEQTLALLTLRQNIYTDPQKPLQIEPKLYSVGQADARSPLVVTTNFSLTYYTVLGEVEASKVPSYILSVDTEGMSVLTAWAAEKFTPERIASALNASGAKEKVGHNTLVIPGYVAVMSGELQETSGWQVVVGPKEAAGLPSFLKNMA